MIGWIKGESIEVWTNNSRKGIIISCCGIGYEIQLLPRNLKDIEDYKEVNLWIHQIYREDGITMFGFKEKNERNLFRKLIEINGIGSQIAISLLEQYKYDELIQAINDENINKLTKVSGIGRRIAERLTVELRGKLPEASIEKKSRITPKGEPLQNSEINDLISEEVIKILRGLDYKDSEIKEAINNLEININSEIKPLREASLKEKDELIDTCLKEALVWLSQEVSSKGA